MISELDFAALKRAMDWGINVYQRANPQLKLFRNPLPTEGSEAWINMAQHAAALAQSYFLGLRPWEQPPADAVDADCASDQELALCETMRNYGISLYEPNVPSALDNANMHRREQAAAPRRATKGRQAKSR
jgi:hypothetical protein